MDRERLLVDTSVLIDHLRKTRKNQTLFYRFSSSCDYVISVVTAFEFGVGASPNNQLYIEQLLASLPILAFDSSCVPVATQIYQELKRKNQLIAPPDIFIAATAIVHDLPLLTLNRKHFIRIPNLNLYSS
jgi:tRNA(fMet)-specific endonuclease VapC